MKRGVVSACMLLAVASCVGDPTDGQTDDRSGPAGFDGGSVDEGDLCPEDQPKSGDDCPRGLLETVTCRYKIDECRVPNGSIYSEYINFCCHENAGQPREWVLCSGDNQCYLFDASFGPAQPTPVDAAVDRPASAPDAGVAPDGGPDAVSDASDAAD